MLLEQIRSKPDVRFRLDLIRSKLEYIRTKLEYFSTSLELD